MWKQFKNVLEGQLLQVTKNTLIKYKYLRFKAKLFSLHCKSSAAQCGENQHV